jgi:hypothetical protein
MQTRWVIANSIEVERFSTVWIEYCTKKKFFNDYDNLTAEQQGQIQDKVEERYIAYLIIVNSGLQHEHLWSSLQEDFAKKINHYPKTIQEAKTYLDTFLKKTPHTDSSIVGQVTYAMEFI